MERRERFDRDADSTIYEMKERRAEWLQEQIIDVGESKSKRNIKIGKVSRQLDLSFPYGNGDFDINDMGEYGYPTKLESRGKFYYRSPDKGERAVIRDIGPKFNLDLNINPLSLNTGIGLRLVKFLWTKWIQQKKLFIFLEQEE